MRQEITSVSIYRVTGTEISADVDTLALEEPLEIRVEFGAVDSRVVKSLSVTMRTPGNDTELGPGFLFTEGIIKNYNNLKGCFNIEENVIQIILREDVTLDIQKTDRNFYTTSSCGVCGKSSIEAIKTVCNINIRNNHILVKTELVYSLPNILRNHQEIFEQTGGLHASALFDVNGTLLMTREDIGRHNALDKLIGAAMIADLLPLDDHILLLSGRASFELIQKAAMAGIRFVAAVGAPSSLAVQLADENDMTLVGFLRDRRFNIYTGAKRIIV